MTWRELAACKGMDTTLFYLGRGEIPTKEVVEACANCQVRTRCLEDALFTEKENPIGIRGGLSANAREREWRNRKSPKVAACGTDSGYFRHRRITRDQPCAACKAAHCAAEQRRLGRAYQSEVA